MKKSDRKDCCFGTRMEEFSLDLAMRESWGSQTLKVDDEPNDEMKEDPEEDPREPTEEME
ncbi:hypothetical protein H5410_044770 [Solanum commersonii]|uniref:Uncharacterized protein n=1 Tax=Solanum commersonii TaxID=4109 RepID=A0A9J5XBU1_SOLCO|nr:hypothetical protein H5410_044770 [Solanum commersonii]